MINETISILKEIVDIGKGSKEYLVFNGSDNKTWLFSKDGVRQGLQTYQPSSLKGTIFKKLLPYCRNNKLLLHLLGVESVRMQIRGNISNIFKSFPKNQKDLRYTFYVGDSTFVDNRKVVVQISDEIGVLAYGKFTKEEAVKSTFEKEIENLKWLEDKGISDIPKVLWSGNVGVCTGFIQSSVGQERDEKADQLTEQHWGFLEKIYKATSCLIPFNNSDFAQELAKRSDLFEKSTLKSKQILLQAIDFIKEYYSNKQMEVAFFHGDFTPWNVCCNGVGIHVFDFEYANKCFPIWLDAFHFFTQAGILSLQLSGDEIYKKFLEQEEFFATRMENPKFVYMCYLVYILGFYYIRWSGKLSEEERSCRVWIKLITILYTTLTEEK